MAKRLDQIGFNIETEQIFSSLSAARHLIDERKLKPMLILEDAALEVSVFLLKTNPPSSFVDYMALLSLVMLS